MAWVQVRTMSEFTELAGDAAVVIDIRHPTCLIWILDRVIGATTAEAVEDQLNQYDRISDYNEVSRVVAGLLARAPATRR